MLAPQRAAAWPAHRGEKVEDRGSVPSGDHDPAETNGARAPQYLQTQGAGTPSPEKDLILPRDLAHIPQGSQDSPGNTDGVFRDGADTSGTSMAPGGVGPGKERGEPLSNR